MLELYGKKFNSRLLIGTARYPSLAVMEEAVKTSGAEIVTVSVRRENAGGKDGDTFWKIIRDLNVDVLPNTAGCYSVEDAVSTAQLARELFNTKWIKLEVLGHKATLQPDVVGTLEAAKILIAEGFEVFPYCTEDLTVALKLAEAGCKVIMPWGSQIGSGKGILHEEALKRMRTELPGVSLIIDAGIGLPSHAAKALEMGFDAVLLNTAVAGSGNPVKMAKAFSLALEAGRAAFEAGMMKPRELAQPSTPVAGTPFAANTANARSS
ncbi:MAG TPA: thiazole synthase [Xanthobacteraceae bacterium]|nr:thiazole synthase [Xanthobacteraceae bacterium]